MSICACGNKKPLNLQPSQKIKEVLGNRGQSSLHFLYRVQKLFFLAKTCTRSQTKDLKMAIYEHALQITCSKTLALRTGH